MTQVISKTRKVGGSLVITIPSEIVQIEQLQPEQWVEIEVKKQLQKELRILLDTN